MNGLPGPSTTDTVTGGKTLELSDYDRSRKPHKIITDDTMINIGARTLSSEICCPICLDLLSSTMGTKECLHRFCSECITTALLRSNKECPTCRKKIVSKRSLRPDGNFDALLSKIWPERKMYDEMQNQAMKNYHQLNSIASLQKSIEAGIKAQAQNRRQRVQGSYDYEKRKRKKRLPENDATDPNSPADMTPPVNGEEVDAVMDAASAGADEDSSSYVSSSTDLSSDSSSITDSTDLDSVASDEGESNPSNEAVEDNDSTIGAPRLENMSQLSPQEGCSQSTKKSSPIIIQRIDEYELELVPSRSLRFRTDIAVSVKASRFIRVPNNTKLEHLSDFLRQAIKSEMTEEEKESEVNMEPITPYFYYSDGEGMAHVPLDEYISNVHGRAVCAEHLRIYFDTVLHDGEDLDDLIESEESEEE